MGGRVYSGTGQMSVRRGFIAFKGPPLRPTLVFKRRGPFLSPLEGRTRPMGGSDALKRLSSRETRWVQPSSAAPLHHRCQRPGRT